MTRVEALRSYTINNAIAAFEEAYKGSLEVGKLGDVTVIDRDILSVPDGELADARVDVTIVGGWFGMRDRGRPFPLLLRPGLNRRRFGPGAPA